MDGRWSVVGRWTAVITIGLALAVTPTAGRCPEKLTWKQISGDVRGISWVVCCDIAEVSAVRLSYDWRLVATPIIDRPLDNLTLAGLESPMSICEDGTVAPARVLGKPCKLSYIPIVQLNVENLEVFDSWYVTCFRTKSGCNFCSLDRYCVNQLECDKFWLSREIVNVTAHNMTILVQATELLENTQLVIKVRISSDDSDQTPNELLDISADIKPNQTLAYLVENLNSSYAYEVKTCIVIRPPEKFRRRAGLFQVPDENVFCLEDAVYKPFRHNGDNPAHTFRASWLTLLTLLVVSTGIIA